MAKPLVDPITLEIIIEGLISIVREMRATIIKTSHSPIISVGRDFSCALFNPSGEMVAQSEDLPAHVLPIAYSIKNSIKVFGKDIQPGDLILHNDPYTGGNHLNDVAIIFPIFIDDELFIFPAIRMHWSDIGGMFPGSITGRARDIYQEGIRIPPIKIMEKGKINQAAYDLLFSNIRLVEACKGDFEAAYAGCKTAERRIIEMVEKYGKNQIVNSVEQHFSRTEYRIRNTIKTIPKGSYRYEDYLELFDDEGEFIPLRISLALRVKDESIVADFTGTSPQVRGPNNQSFANTVGAVIIVCKSILDPKGPINEGTFKPFEVIAPEGTILNLKHPAPSGSVGEVRKRCMSVVCGALSQIIPNKLGADSQGTSNHIMIGIKDAASSKESFYYEYNAGGSGALSHMDGENVLPTLDQGDITTVIPVESLEINNPVVLIESTLRMDSGGPGKFRGGLGMRRRIRILSSEASYSILADRAIVPPFGVFHGMSGKTNDYYIIRNKKRIDFLTPGKVSGFSLKYGDEVVVETAGGGGYGDPLDRDIKKIQEDINNDIVSINDAEANYGIVFNKELTINDTETILRRNRLKKQQIICKAELGSTGDSFKSIGEYKHRICKLSPLLADNLGLKQGELLELIGRNATPLRAWAVIDDNQASDYIRIDNEAFKILGINRTDNLYLRKI